MFTIAYGFFVEFPFGTSVGEFLIGEPTARSDPCEVAAVCRPEGGWHCGFSLGTGTPKMEKPMDEQLKTASLYLRCGAHDDAEAEKSFEGQAKRCFESAREAGYWADPELVCRERGSGLGLDRPEPKD